MKALILAMTSIALALPAIAQGPDEKNIKVRVDHLEKSWGIKFKSVAVTNGARSGVPVKEIKITLEFTKDITEAADLADLRKALTPPFFSPKKDPEIRLYFFLFDDDNVAVQKLLIEELQGELSGKAGDAFRVLIFTGEDTLKKTRKIESRPAEKPSEKGTAR